MAQPRRIGEHASFVAHFPDALIGLTPCVHGGVRQRSEWRVEVPIERATTLHPLIRAVEDLAIHIVLSLVSRPVSPANGRRAAIALQLGVLALIGNRVTLNVIHDPGATATFEGIEHPSQKRTSLVMEADPSECVDGKRRITDPRISVVPVP